MQRHHHRKKPKITALEEKMLQFSLCSTATNGSPHANNSQIGTTVYLSKCHLRFSHQVTIFSSAHFQQKNMSVKFIYNLIF
jgi:hypothetical protein